MKRLQLTNIPSRNRGSRPSGDGFEQRGHLRVQKVSSHGAVMVTEDLRGYPFAVATLIRIHSPACRAGGVM